MPSTGACPKALDQLLEYRLGARYCKMDLHTHSPASECSSFALPAAVERVLPQKDGTSASAWRKQCHQFVTGLDATTEKTLKTACDQALAQQPRLSKEPRSANLAPVRGILKEWCEDIACVLPADGARPSPEQVKLRDECVTLALRDVRNYLASLFFPEEFVLRCYIEQLELVALTDHNHPGYIVPRLPQHGTWFSALESVNETFRHDILQGRPRAGKLREAMLARLQLGRQRLQAQQQGLIRQDAETRKQHKDVRKKLASMAERAKHIDDMLDHWKDEANEIRPLTLLPGVEITVSDVHLLCHFPPEWHIPGRIGSILRAIGIPEEQWGRGFIAAASSSVQHTVSLVNGEGGVGIPAHSNSDFKGILRLFKKGLALTKVLEHPGLLALETIGGSVIAKVEKSKAKSAWETLQWLDTGQSRPARTRHLCFLKGSDAHECRIELDGTGEDLGQRYTNVKIDIRPDDSPQEVFRSLRLALLSGQSRVIEHPIEDGFNYRGTGEAARIPAGQRENLLGCEKLRPTILGITAHGAGSYMDGLCVRFNPYLNCVIGSGGKSALVRLVGYAFGAQGFMKGTKDSWLPELVRVFWQEGDTVYCLERSGRQCCPADATVSWLERGAEGGWAAVEGRPIEKAKDIVEIWPPPKVQDDKSLLSGFEDNVVDQLIQQLAIDQVEGAKPLLVNQPRDIFNSRKLFDEVLRKPQIKARQMIWSTGSTNVPAALDAEKIIVTRETKRGRQMEIVCAGDLHEDDIRDQYLNHFEGGWPGFARRLALYQM